ncbi:unnamed protein product [Orchesella dallaii]|uniref:Arrestin C-terminal-like domain-containing protein n=1 Tax=Orchesella dallaii TaxID=48710 RepID=A0ABP1PI32_9HEXA
MGIKIYITFDNSHAIYRPEEFIRGSIFVNTGEITQLTLTFHGEGNVLWRETKFGHDAQNAYDQHNGRVLRSSSKIHPSSTSPYHISSPHLSQSEDRWATQVDLERNRDTNEIEKIVLEFQNQETYLHAIQNIPVPINPEESKNIMEQNIPFSFKLPTNLPTSCELTHGSVKYYLEVCVTYKNSGEGISHDISECVKEPFHILGTLDLSRVNGSLRPFVVENREHFYSFLCLCLRGGEFVMRMSLGRSGYIPGEKISFELSYKNDTRVTIKKVTARLVETITYIAEGKKISEVKEMCEVPHFTKIFSGDKGACLGQLPVSHNALITDLGGCRIIRVRYAFIVTAIGSCGREAVVEVPITIGERAPIPGLTGEMTSVKQSN